MRQSGQAPSKLRMVPGRAERRRHQRKYAEGDLGPERSFYFRGADGKLNLQAQNLLIFMQIADGVDDETWMYHLKRGTIRPGFESLSRMPISLRRLRLLRARATYPHPRAGHAFTPLSRSDIRWRRRQRCPCRQKSLRLSCCVRPVSRTEYHSVGQPVIVMVLKGSCHGVYASVIGLW